MMTCDSCGCTNQHACVLPARDGGLVQACAWAAPSLCTACVDNADPAWIHPDDGYMRPSWWRRWLAALIGVRR